MPLLNITYAYAVPEEKNFQWEYLNNKWKVKKRERKIIYIWFCFFLEYYKRIKAVIEKGSIFAWFILFNTTNLRIGYANNIYQSQAIIHIIHRYDTDTVFILTLTCVREREKEEAEAFTKLFCNRLKTCFIFEPSLHSWVDFCQLRWVYCVLSSDLKKSFYSIRRLWRTAEEEEV